MPNRARKIPQTEFDLTSIYNFIADDSLKAADAWLGRIEATFDMLARAVQETTCWRISAAFPSGAT
jgi:hypothetical protein